MNEPKPTIADTGTRNRLVSLFRDTLEEADLVAKLEAEFSAGLPIGAHFLAAAHEPANLLDLAREAKNEPAMVYILKKDPSLVKRPEMALRSFCGFPSVVAHLLETGYIPKNQATSEWRDLQNMFFQVHPDSLKLMAEKGLDLDVKINIYATPAWALMHCVRYRSIGLLRAFAEAGANLKVTEDDGATILHVAVSGPKKFSSGELDVETKIPDFRATVEMALAGGLDIDTPDSAGQTALHHAAKRGYVNKTVELVNLGARFDVKDARGRTPEKLAKSAKHLEVAAKLAALRAHQAVQRTIKGMATSPPSPRQP